MDRDTIQGIENKVALRRLWNREYIKVMMCNFLLFFAFYLLTPLLPLYLDEQFNADKDMIGIVLSGYVVATLLIRPFSGFVVDSFDRKRVLTICFFFILYSFHRICRGRHLVDVCYCQDIAWDTFWCYNCS